MHRGKWFSVGILTGVFLLISAMMFLLYTKLQTYVWVLYGITLCAVGVAVFVSVILIKYIHKQNIDPLTQGMSEFAFENEFHCHANVLDRYALLRIGIKQFDQWNQKLGYETGSEILKIVHNELKKGLDHDEFICRVYADNFLILMRFDDTGIQDLAKDTEEVFVRKIIEKLDDRIYFYEGGPFDKNLFLSYGVYQLKKGSRYQQAKERANIARVGNKDFKDYNSSVGIYGRDFTSEKNTNDELKEKMADALASGHIVPYFQPKYELQHETIHGAEVLMRWIDPEIGFISPADCVPLFETTGFIRYVDLYMFEKALQLLQKWKDENLPLIRISVNLSQANFLSIHVFLKNIKEIYEKYDVPTEYIEFELTESMVFEEEEKICMLIQQLHELGFHCSMDDFGSGYSSLSMLKSLPVRTLKLDQMMFRGEEQQRAKIISKGFIKIAKELGMEVVAEGIETRDYVDFLKQEKCDMIQGYYFSKPLNQEEFEQLYRKQLGK